jgi:hypothetical protein
MYKINNFQNLQSFEIWTFVMHDNHLCVRRERVRVPALKTENKFNSKFSIENVQFSIFIMFP